MDPKMLRQIFVLNGVVPNTATDEEIQNAYTYMQNTEPARLKELFATVGVAMPSTIPWMTIIGVSAGAVAIWYLWKQSQKKKPLDAFEYPEPEGDNAPRLRGMSRALSHFKGSSGCSKRMGSHSHSSCNPACGPGKLCVKVGGRPTCATKYPKRASGMGGLKKYEFEPEIRLEGYGKRRSRR